MNNPKYFFVLVGRGYYYYLNSLESVRIYAWHKFNPYLKSFRHLIRWESLPIIPPIYDFIQLFWALKLLLCLILSRHFTWKEKIYVLHLIKFKKDKNLELGNRCGCLKNWIKILFPCKVKGYAIVIMNLRVIWRMKGHGITC